MVIVDGDDTFTDCEYIKGYAFKNVVEREKYALLPVICTIFGLLQDMSAHFCRIECLLPQSCLT
jgi:hypothetical protein